MIELSNNFSDSFSSAELSEILSFVSSRSFSSNWNSRDAWKAEWPDFSQIKSDGIQIRSRCVPLRRTLGNFFPTHLQVELPVLKRKRIWIIILMLPYMVLICPRGLQDTWSKRGWLPILMSILFTRTISFSRSLANPILAFRIGTLTYRPLAAFRKPLCHRYLEGDKNIIRFIPRINTKTPLEHKRDDIKFRTNFLGMSKFHCFSFLCMFTPQQRLQFLFLENQKIG